jgi:hypothetical protein
VPSYDDPERTVDDAWTGPVRTPHRAEVEDIGVHDPRVEWPPAPPFPPVGVHVVRVGGCVRRLVILFVVLLVLAALAFFGLLGVGTRLLFGTEASVTVAQAHRQPALRRAADGSGSIRHGCCGAGVRGTRGELD